MDLSKACLAKLDGVHPHLKSVVLAAADGQMKFRVIEGARTLARQRALMRQGASRTLRSRHIIAPNGLAHAVDLAVMIGGRISWEVPLYHRLADQVQSAAKRLGVPVEWGGDWRGFFDGPHFQLPWDRYPGTAGVTETPPPAPEPRELATIVPGSKGPDVTRLQEALRAIGHDVAVDGDFGPKTRSATLNATAVFATKPTDIITATLLERLEKAAAKARKVARDA